MRFDFDLTDKSNNNLDEKITKNISPKDFKRRVRSTLETGGRIELNSSGKKPVIIFPTNFLESHCDYKLKFTNLIDITEIPKTTLKSLKRIIEDPEYISKETTEVVLNNTNGRNRLRKILKLYRKDEMFKENDNILYKVRGASYKDINGKSDPFRIYLKAYSNSDGENVYDLILCDIYHLCIPSYHNGLRPQQMLQQTFSLHYNNKHNKHLREVLDNIN